MSGGIPETGFDPVRHRAQVVAQCRVVAHFAIALAEVHSQKADAFEAGAFPTILEMTGQDTARLMEMLGDVLNEMDAVDEGEDAWTYPIFAATQKLFPGDAPAGTTTPAKPDHTAEGVACGAIVNRVLQNVCGLPDRSSPDDEPDMLLVKVDELDWIVRNALASGGAAS